jgi:bacterioferritin (cytochrome b1)
LPDFADGGIDARVDINEDVPAPESIDDVIAKNELAASLDQQNQHVHWLTTQLHPAAETAQFAPCDIEFKVAEA